MTTIAATTESSPSNQSARGPDFIGGDDVNCPTKLRRSPLHSPWAQVVRSAGSGGGVVGESSVEPPAAVDHLPPQAPSPSPLALSAALEPASPTGSSASKRPSPPLPPPPPAPVQQQASTSSESSAAAGFSDDRGGGNVGSSSKKPAWNKSHNGAYEAFGDVMGASSWPSLSEGTRPASRSSSDHQKSVSDGGGLNDTESQPQAPNSPQPKQGNVNTKPISATGNAPPGRQRSVKQGAGGNRHGGPARALNTPPPFPVVSQVHEVVQNNTSQVAPIVPYAPPPRETGPIIGSPSSHLQPWNGHSMPRSSSWRGNCRPHAHRDGSRHNYQGVRRNHGGGPNNWNNAPDWNTRGFHGQPRRGGGRGFAYPTGPVFPTYMGPPPVRPYGNALVYHDPSAPMYYVPTLGSEPFGPMPQPYPSPQTPGSVMFPVVMPDAKSLSIVNQIDYYFSDENLVKDEFLRSNMDAEGWVPVSLISSFPRIRSMNASIPFILKALELSNVVEVQDNRMRKRDGWTRWIPRNWFTTSSVWNTLAGPTHDELAASLEKASLDAGAAASDQVGNVDKSSSSSNN